MNHNGVATNYNGETAVHRHRLVRIILYSLLFASSLILLGLTAERIHYTRKFLGGFEGIVVELLVTSIVTLIISMLLIHTLLSRTIGFMRKTAELATLLLIWAMSLIGAAIVTHDWMNTKSCRGIFKECRIIDAIKAFSWIIFGLSTILVVLRLVNWRRDHADARVGGRGKHNMATAPTANRATVV